MNPTDKEPLPYQAYCVRLATDSEFAARSGCLLFVKRIIKADFDLLAGNIPHPRYAVGPGFECPSRIVVARRLRKSAASVTSCLVGHRSKKAIFNYFLFANRFRCTKD